ncbi:MAG: YeeE/YedE thiosulfate transporter family protein [Solirubrobacterales bacterium]
MEHHQLAWYVAGPVLGLCVLACRVLFNARLGVTGGFSELVSKLSRGSVRFDWRGWFAIGVALGGTVFALAAGGPDFHGYGWMTDTFDGSGRIAIPFLLLGAGALNGYGAKASGGCTSGNGLSGTSLLSPASLAATATFFGTAIGVSFLMKAVI